MSRKINIKKAEPRAEVVPVYRQTIIPNMKISKVIEILKKDYDNEVSKLFEVIIKGDPRTIGGERIELDTKADFHLTMFDNTIRLNKRTYKIKYEGDEYGDGKFVEKDEEYTLNDLSDDMVILTEELAKLDSGYKFTIDNIYIAKMVIKSLQTDYFVKYDMVRKTQKDSEVGAELKDKRTKPTDACDLYTADISNRYNLINKQRIPEAVKESEKYYDDTKFLDPRFILAYAPGLFNAEYCKFTECSMIRKTEVVDIYRHPPDTMQGISCSYIPQDKLLDRWRKQGLIG